MPPKGSAKKKKTSTKRKASDDAGPSTIKRSSAAAKEAAAAAQHDETEDAARREDEQEEQQQAREEEEEEEGEEGAPAYEELRAAALHLMLRTVPLPRDKAVRALDSTQQHKDDVAQWVDEAQVWLACEAECAEEADKMGAAMEISLVEEEERKAAKKPLVDLTGSELLAEFEASEILISLGTALSAGDLQAALELETLKPKFIEYLELEQKCKKWWKCSKGWFENAAKQLKERLLAAQPCNGGAAGAAENAAVVDSEAGGANEGGQAEQQHSDGMNVQVQATLLFFLDEQVPFIRKEAYAMPADEKQMIPLVFEAFVESEEVVVLVE